VLRFLVLGIPAIFRPKALLITENLCLRQQMLVLLRRHPRPHLSNADRHFWITTSRWFAGGVSYARDSFGLAATGLEGVLVAIFSPSKRWSSSHFRGASGSHWMHGRGESSVGAKTHPSRVGEIRVSDFRQNPRQLCACAAPLRPSQFEVQFNFPVCRLYTWLHCHATTPSLPRASCYPGFSKLALTPRTP
jgi:hypothetical protein